MHYHCEIVLPPGTDVVEGCRLVLADFDENSHDEDEGRPAHAFWDWYVIGGRWAGHKLLGGLDGKQRNEFELWIQGQGVMQLGFVAGKPELAPEFVDLVDAKWREMFPGAGDNCPLFKHSNNQYGYGLEGAMPGDIMCLGEAPDSLTCERVIFAGPSFNSDEKDWTGPLRAVYMLARSFWNGVNHEDTTWDGKVLTAVEMMRGNFEGYNPDYRERIEPNDEWLVVTVDYHS